MTIDVPTAEPQEPGVAQAGASPDPRPVIVLLVLAAIGEASYWGTFFGTDAMVYPSVPCFRTFDLSFPAANLWTTLTALVGAAGLWRRSSTGVLSGILCGSSLVYLGLVDVAFNVGNAMYRQPNAAIYGEMFVNLTSFTLAPYVIWWLWKHRASLGA
ncbi:MAG: hypothetical protein AB7H96_04890 [Vicinamibacterales bacterium]